MKAMLVVLVMLASTMIWAADEPLAFKGLALGSTEKEALKKYPKLKCSGSPQRRSCFHFHDRTEEVRLLIACQRRGQSGDVCIKLAREESGGESVAGALVRSMSFRFYDGKLGTISFTIASSLFDKVSTAFLDTYGKPTADEVTPFNTKGGQTYENRELQWHLPGGNILLQRLSGRIDNSRVLYASDEALLRIKAEMEDGRKRAAGDF